MKQSNRTNAVLVVVVLVAVAFGYALGSGQATGFASLLPLGGASPSPSETPRPTQAPVVAQASTATSTVVPTPTNTPVPTATITPTPTNTATPMPTPTPTPRIKPPPSAYKRLQDYPRPARDSGYGFHINASPYPPEQEIMVYQAIPTLKQLGATWVTVWVADENQLDRIKPLIDNGFEVVLRFHPIGTKPHPDYVPPKEYIAKYVAAGVHYFVSGNEPNLTLETSGGGPDAIARQWMMASDNIKAAGGIPMLYPMSPGGDQNHRVMLEGIMEWLKANDALDTLDGAAIAVHNRPHNKPLEVRDDSSFLEYEWIDDLVVKYFGRSLPIIGTEAGYTVGEERDRRYPKTDLEGHRVNNLAIITGFRDGRWRDSLFAQNFWILGEFGYRAPQFMADPWVFNPLNNGQDLPIVGDLKAMPKFVRKFQGEGFKTR